MELTKTVEVGNRWYNDFYSNVPFEIGCAFVDGIFDVYEVDERGVPESFFKTSDENEALNFYNIVVKAAENKGEKRESKPAGNRASAKADKARKDFRAIIAARQRRRVKEKLIARQKSKERKRIDEMSAIG